MDNNRLEKKTEKKSGGGVLFSSLKIAVATFSSRIFGLIREQAMAYGFGASGLTDAFIVAYRIPNLLRDLFAEGAFSSAFVPVFVEEMKKSPEKSRELFKSVWMLLFLITGIISFGTFLFADNLISIFAPNFLLNPEKFHITVVLTKWMSPFLLLISLAALVMGVLNAEKIFFIPSFSPVAFNIMTILSIFFLPPLISRWGYPAIYSLGIGVLFGGVFQIMFQLPKLFSLKYFFGIPKKLFTIESKRILLRLGPGLIGFAATQINLLINTVLATQFVGAASWINYAFRLFQFPVGVVGVSLANSNLIYFSTALKSGDTENAIKIFRNSYFYSLVIMLPLSLFIYFLAEDIVAIVFERGRFSHSDTLKTAAILKMYTLGLPGYAIYKLTNPTFYALDKPKIPVIISVISILINIVFCVCLTPYFGHIVLALGTSVSMIVNSIFSLLMIFKILKIPFIELIKGKDIKVLIASALASIVTFKFSINILNFKIHFLGMILKFIVCFIIFTTIYLIALMAFGEQSEIKKIISNVVKRVKK